MPILIRREQVDPANATLSATLGIDDIRKEQLQFLCKKLADRNTGNFIDDIQILARECNNNEEFAFSLFQWGVNVGASLAATGRSKN